MTDGIILDFTHDILKWNETKLYCHIIQRLNMPFHFHEHGPVWKQCLSPRYQWTTHIPNYESNLVRTDLNQPMTFIDVGDYLEPNSKPCNEIKLEMDIVVL